MNGCLACRCRCPLKSAVREIDLKTLGKQMPPQNFYLQPLANGVGRHKGRLHLRLDSHDARSLYVPISNIVEHARAFDTTTNGLRIGFLLFALVSGANKRRIAKNVIGLRPLHAQGIGIDDFCTIFQRNAGAGLAKALGSAQIALVVGEPHGNFGDLRGVFVDFDTVKLTNVAALHSGDVEQLVFSKLFADEVVFELA